MYTHTVSADFIQRGLERKNALHRQAREGNHRTETATTMKMNLVLSCTDEVHEFLQFYFKITEKNLLRLPLTTPLL